MGERRMDNAGAKRPCAHTVAVRATHQTCAPTNFAASTAEAPTQQPTKAAHSNICALPQTDQVWDVYPILRSIETSIGRSRR